MSSAEVDGIRVLNNPSFEQPGEEGAAPDEWEGPVLLEGETDPSRDGLEQREGHEPEYGDFVAYLRYGSTVSEGWTGLAYEQTEEQFGKLTGPAELLLAYRIRHQYSAGVDHVSDHGGLVEVELHSNGETYRLRYLHPRHGDLPQTSEYIAYVNAGDPGWQTWTWYEHNLDEDISAAFPDQDTYTIMAIRIGVLTHKSSPEESLFYWLFDKVQLFTESSESALSF
ncbi:MAG: hypothetical protein R6U88_06250 [Candidatus Bipolaricaulota bacterium]